MPSMILSIMCLKKRGVADLDASMHWYMRSSEATLTLRKPIEMVASCRQHDNDIWFASRCEIADYMLQNGIDWFTAKAGSRCGRGQ